MNESIYLVTGAAGFLGGTICRQLTDRGNTVRALVLPGDKAAEHIPPAVEQIEGDICDIDSLNKFFSVPKDRDVVVIHLASIITLNPDYNQRVMDVNVEGTKHIIQMCLQRRQNTKLVYCSSATAIPEASAGKMIAETDTYFPDRVKGCYSQSKAAASQEVLNSVHHDGLNACIILPSGILGPGDYAMGESTRTIIQLVEGKIPMGLDGSFNMVDVRDLAHGVILAADYGAAGESYILGNDEVTFREVTKLVAEEAGCKPVRIFLPIPLAYFIARHMEKAAKKTGKKPLMTTFSVYNLARNNRFDSTKARSQLGYRTRPYRETMRDEIRWMKREGLI